MNNTGTWARIKDTIWFRALLGTVVGLLFVGSVLLSVFAGGEFFESQAAKEVKGFLRLKEAKYTSAYLEGDPFKFDKASARVNLVAKDPDREEIVVVDALDDVGYGFQVNGEGDIYLNASDITMATGVEKISVVSRDYPTLKADLPVTVVSADGVELKDELLLEAETDADLYREDELIDYEAKITQPASDKPYFSSFGTSPDGLNCSGGACLRNFQSQNMKVVYRIVCAEETEVELCVLLCRRPKNPNLLSDWFDITLNGEHITDLEGQTIPQAEGSGYYELYTTAKVTITLPRGLNEIVFVSGARAGKSSPGNLDAISLKAEKAVIGLFPVSSPVPEPDETEEEPADDTSGEDAA